MNESVTDNGRDRLIAGWLLLVCALIFAMVVLGGVTRLTGSGLSMVHWQPIKGVLPPMNQADWQELFQRYQEFPEFQKINRHMDLEDFKGIFWLEYLHRILGRIIGLAFLLPFLVLLFLKRIPRSLTPQLAVMFILGGLQGLMGWYMVKSGLVDNPHVSQYRLTAHLMLAVLIYGYILWTALGLMRNRLGPRDAPGALRGFSVLLTALVVLTMAAGGFVAGLKAGLAYNTFPLMGGQLVPDGMFVLEPWFMNLFENITTVQFNHRVLGLTTALAVLVVWFLARGRTLTTATRFGLHAVLAMAVVQAGLGIATLLQHVPVALGALHQAGALTLFTLALYVTRRVFPPAVG